MKKERSNTKIVLIDIQFYESLNEFEYQFGESITYKQIEQRSYISFKDIMFESISRDIKFRKFGRFGKILTIKAEMQKSEITKFKNLLESDLIDIGFGWIISNVTLIKDNKIKDHNIKLKRIKTNDDDEEEDEDSEESDEIENLENY